MADQKMQEILKKLALQYNSTPEEVHKEMEIAIEAGQCSTDPAVQAMWRSIPRKGEKLTVKEFIEYAAAAIMNVS